MSSCAVNTTPATPATPTHVYLLTGNPGAPDLYIGTEQSIARITGIPLENIVTGIHPGQTVSCVIADPDVYMSMQQLIQYHTDELVRIGNEWIDSTGDTRIHIMAHSMGCHMCVEILANLERIGAPILQHITGIQLVAPVMWNAKDIPRGRDINSLKQPWILSAIYVVVQFVDWVPIAVAQLIGVAPPHHGVLQFWHPTILRNMIRIWDDIASDVRDTKILSEDMMRRITVVCSTRDEWTPPYVRDHYRQWCGSGTYLETNQIGHSYCLYDAENDWVVSRCMGGRIN
jgi:predicted alpha/beta hydrolase family esterase